jgi:hypothetical protein
VKGEGQGLSEISSAYKKSKKLLRTETFRGDIEKFMIFATKLTI